MGCCGSKPKRYSSKKKKKSTPCDNSLPQSNKRDELHAFSPVSGVRAPRTTQRTEQLARKQLQRSSTQRTLKAFMSCGCHYLCVEEELMLKPSRASNISECAEIRKHDQNSDHNLRRIMKNERQETHKPLLIWSPIKLQLKWKEKMKKPETKADFYAKYVGPTESFCTVANVQMTM